MLDNSKRRKSSAPCNVCSTQIHADQEIIYCPECGEHYHLTCWHKIGNKCRIAACSGKSYTLWNKAEPAFLKFLKIGESRLLATCPNCQSDISPLHRYCKMCGSDVNRPEKQKTFKFFHLSLFVRKFRKIVYLFAVLLGLAGIFGVGAFAVNAAGDVRNLIDEYATQNAPTMTSTNDPFITTFTPTARPSLTNTHTPESIDNPQSTFTNTPRPTATLIPSPTKIRTPEAKRVFAFVTINPTDGQAPITVKFNAERSYVEYDDGTREYCYMLGCEYKWKFPGGIVYDFSAVSNAPFRFIQSGTFNVYLTVCWEGICDDNMSTVTIY